MKFNTSLYNWNVAIPFHTFNFCFPSLYYGKRSYKALKIRLE